MAAIPQLLKMEKRTNEKEEPNRAGALSMAAFPIESKIESQGRVGRPKLRKDRLESKNKETVDLTPLWLD